MGNGVASVHANFHSVAGVAARQWCRAAGRAGPCTRVWVTLSTVRSLEGSLGGGVGALLARSIRLVPTSRRCTMPRRSAAPEVATEMPSPMSAEMTVGPCQPGEGMCRHACGFVHHDDVVVQVHDTKAVHLFGRMSARSRGAGVSATTSPAKTASGLADFHDLCRYWSRVTWLSRIHLRCGAAAHRGQSLASARPGGIPTESAPSTVNLAIPADSSVALVVLPMRLSSALCFS